LIKEPRSFPRQKGNCNSSIEWQDASIVLPLFLFSSVQVFNGMCPEFVSSGHLLFLQNGRGHHDYYLFIPTINSRGSARYFMPIS
jgi:hypothetical protein